MNGATDKPNDRTVRYVSRKILDMSVRADLKIQKSKIRRFFVFTIDRHRQRTDYIHMVQMARQARTLL